ncbi:hypothetical protein QP181_15665 [Sphingomonas sp. LR55]
MKIAPGLSGARRPWVRQRINTFVPSQHAGRIAAIGRAENPDRVGDVAVDGAWRDTELYGDLLGLAQRGHAAQHVAVPVRQTIDAGFFHLIPLHRAGGITDRACP